MSGTQQDSPDTPRLTAEVEAILEARCSLEGPNATASATAPSAAPRRHRAAIDLRSDSLLAGKVRAALGCTVAELNRWQADGRLPHLFIRAIPGIWMRATPSRFWAVSVVEQAVRQVSEWRARDQDRRRTSFQNQMKRS